MESAHHSLSRPDRNNTADVPSFTLHTALSAIPFVSDLCGVDVQWFQEESSQDLPNSKELSVYTTWGFLFGSKNFWQAPLCFLRSFRSARIRLDPLGGQVLHHDCISMITAWFTFFTENFCDPQLLNHQNFLLWARLYQHVFCKKPLFFSVFKQISQFGSFWEASVDTVLTRVRFHFCSRLQW